MKRDLIDTKPIVSSFLSCEKDTETILKKLFVESRPYSDVLKKLLVVQNKNVLDENYDMSEYTMKRLIDEKYIILSPRVDFEQFENSLAIPRR